MQYIMNNREKLGGCLPMRSPAKAAIGERDGKTQKGSQLFQVAKMEVLT